MSKTTCPGWNVRSCLVMSSVTTTMTAMTATPTAGTLVSLSVARSLASLSGTRPLTLGDAIAAVTGS